MLLLMTKFSQLKYIQCIDDDNNSCFCALLFVAKWQLTQSWDKNISSAVWNVTASENHNPVCQIGVNTRKMPSVVKEEVVFGRTKLEYDSSFFHEASWQISGLSYLKHKYILVDVTSDILSASFNSL